MLVGKIIRKNEKKTSSRTKAHNELQTGNRRSRATDFNTYKERKVEMTPANIIRVGQIIEMGGSVQ